MAAVDTMPSRWLITGGCGFIGVSLMDEIFRRWPEASVRVVDSLVVGTEARAASIRRVARLDPSNITAMSAANAGQIELLVADIQDANIALKAAEGADVVVHLAANTGVQPSLNDPGLDLASNVMGTFNYLEAVRHNKVGAFIFASSGAPTGDVQPPITEETVCRPLSPYGASKLAGEAYCSAYYHSYGVKTVALRFSNVYGPLSDLKDSVVARFLKRAFDGEPLVINGDGSQTRDFIFNGDLVNAIIAAARSGLGGEVFQISTGIETSVRELTEEVQKVLKTNAGIAVDVAYGEPLTGDMPRNYADNSKAKRLLDWRPEIMLGDGLELTVRYFLEAQAGKRLALGAE